MVDKAPHGGILVGHVLQGDFPLVLGGKLSLVALPGGGDGAVGRHNGEAVDLGHDDAGLHTVGTEPAAAEAQVAAVVLHPEIDGAVVGQTGDVGLGGVGDVDHVLGCAEVLVDVGRPCDGEVVGLVEDGTAVHPADVGAVGGVLLNREVGGGAASFHGEEGGRGPVAGVVVAGAEATQVDVVVGGLRKLAEVVARGGLGNGDGAGCHGVHVDILSGNVELIAVEVVGIGSRPGEGGGVHVDILNIKVGNSGASLALTAGAEGHLRKEGYTGRRFCALTCNVGGCSTIEVHSIITRFYRKIKIDYKISTIVNKRLVKCNGHTISRICNNRGVIHLSKPISANKSGREVFFSGCTNLNLKHCIRPIAVATRLTTTFNIVCQLFDAGSYQIS